MDPLKQLLQAKKAEKKEIKKKMKEAKAQEKVTLRKELVKIDWYLETFKVSAMQPVKIEGIIVNYKMYQSIMKKLKGFEVSQFIVGNSLTILFKTNGSDGSYVLLDLSPFFPKGAVFPEVKLESW